MGVSKTTIIINEFGAALRKRGKRFLIVTPEKPKVEIAACNVEKMVLPTKGASITCDALSLAMECKIPVMVSDYSGKPTAYFSNPLESGLLSMRRVQYSSAFSQLGFSLAKSVIKGKIRNQRGYLLRKARNISDKSKKLGTQIRESCSKLQTILDEIESIPYTDSSRNVLFGQEGNAASIYWSAYGSLISLRGDFSKRLTRGSKDFINNLLNYGYAILRSEVQSAIIGCGLDPFAGFLHTDRSRKPSLVLDLMEEFRTYIVDTEVANLILHRSKRREVTVIEDRKLGIETRRNLATAIQDRLHNNILVNAVQTRVKDIILKQVKSVADSFQSGTSLHTPITFKW